MRFSFKQLKKLLVETQTGNELGKVHDIVFDTEKQGIVQYKVKGPLFSTKEYLVSRDQVVRFEQDKMIVLDSVVKRGLEEVQKVQDDVLPEVAVLDKVDS